MRCGELYRSEAFFYRRLMNHSFVMPRKKTFCQALSSLVCGDCRYHFFTNIWFLACKLRKNFERPNYRAKNNLHREGSLSVQIFLASYQLLGGCPPVFEPTMVLFLYRTYRKAEVAVFVNISTSRLCICELKCTSLLIVMLHRHSIVCIARPIIAPGAFSIYRWG